MHYEKTVFGVEMFAYRNTQWRPELAKAIASLREYCDKGLCDPGDPDAPWWGMRITGADRAPKSWVRQWRTDEVTEDAISGICPSPIVVLHEAMSHRRHSHAAEAMGITHDYFVQLMRASNIVYPNLGTSSCSLPRDLAMRRWVVESLDVDDPTDIVQRAAAYHGMTWRSLSYVWRDIGAQLALYYKPEKLIAWRNRIAARAERATLKASLIRLAPLDMVGEYECAVRFMEVLGIGMREAHDKVIELGGVSGVRAWRDRLCR